MIDVTDCILFHAPRPARLEFNHIKCGLNSLMTKMQLVLLIQLADAEAWFGNGHDSYPH